MQKAAAGWRNTISNNTGLNLDLFDEIEKFFEANGPMDIEDLVDNDKWVTADNVNLSHFFDSPNGAAHSLGVSVEPLLKRFDANDDVKFSLEEAKLLNSHLRAVGNVSDIHNNIKSPGKVDN